MITSDIIQVELTNPLNLKQLSIYWMPIPDVNILINPLINPKNTQIKDLILTPEYPLTCPSGVRILHLSSVLKHSEILIENDSYGITI